MQSRGCRVVPDRTTTSTPSAGVAQTRGTVVRGPWPDRRAAPVPDYAAYIAASRTAVACVAARFRLSPTAADDLFGDLWVRLLADDGRVLRQFRQDARIETYLTTIACNLVIDRRRKTDGKWRASARALRERPEAAELERLIVRDGIAADMAVECVAGARPEAQRGDLLRYARTVTRKTRPREVASDTLANRPSDAPSPYDVLAARDAATTADAAVAALGAALAPLHEEDRRLLMWRYVDGMTVATLATALRVEHKPLYRRFERLLAQLRASLEALGVSGPAVLELLGTAGQPARVPLLRWPTTGTAEHAELAASFLERKPRPRSLRCRRLLRDQRSRVCVVTDAAGAR